MQNGVATGARAGWNRSAVGWVDLVCEGAWAPTSRGGGRVQLVRAVGAGCGRMQQHRKTSTLFALP